MQVPLLRAARARLGRLPLQDRDCRSAAHFPSLRFRYAVHRALPMSFRRRFRSGTLGATKGESLIARNALQSGVAMADHLLTLASLVGQHAASLVEDLRPTSDYEHVPAEQCSAVVQEAATLLRAHFERAA